MQAPIFVVGMPRSGTTLLSAMLDAHSAIAITPETHFYTRCWNAERRVPDSIEAVWERLVQQPGVQDLQLTAEEMEHLREAACQSQRPSPSDLLRALGTIYAERNGAQVWGEKTPDHLAHVPAMMRDFPEAAVLCIVRDARDVCLSLRGLPWNEDSLPESAWTWRRYAQKSTRYQTAFPDRYREVRYEDLLARPEATLRELTAWIGCPFEKRMLGFHRQRTGPADTEREPWKANTHQPVDPSNTEKWRAQMTDAERAVVELIAGSALESYGYSRPPLTVDSDFLRNLGRVLLQTARTIAQRWVQRWRTPQRAPGDHTPEWIRRQTSEAGGGDNGDRAS